MRSTTSAGDGTMDPNLWPEKAMKGFRGLQGLEGLLGALRVCKGLKGFREVKVLRFFLRDSKVFRVQSCLGPFFHRVFLASLGVAF